MDLLQTMKRAFPRTVPVLAGYIFLGIAYGVALKAKGYGPEWAVFISATVYAGSMQFAMLPVLTQPFAPVTVAFMTLLVNARHVFYGLSMLKTYEGTGKYKPYLIFAMSDETYSLHCLGVPADVDKAQWLTAISVMDQTYRVLGSLLGGLLGQILPFDLTGIDFAMTALFTVIFTEQTTDALHQYRQGRLTLTDALFPTLLGLSVTLISLMLVGRESFLLCAMAIMLGCFFLRYSWHRKETCA